MMIPGGILVPEVAAVTVQELSLGLRAAEVCGHFRRVRFSQEAEISLLPCLKADGQHAIVHAADGSPCR